MRPVYLVVMDLFVAPSNPLLSVSEEYRGVAMLHSLFAALAIYFD